MIVKDINSTVSKIPFYKTKFYVKTKGNGVQSLHLRNKDFIKIPLGEYMFISGEKL